MIWLLGHVTKIADDQKYALSSANAVRTASFAALVHLK